MAAPKMRKKSEFKTEWFSVESENIHNLKSRRGKPFYRFIIPNSTMILALTEDQKIILIRQYRASVEANTLELPCGQIEKGESPRKAAIRELYEETGYICNKVSFLNVGRPWIDRSNSRLYLYYGLGAVREKKFKPQEKIQVIPVTAERFRNLAINGRLEQLQCFAPIFLAKWKFGLEI